MSSGWQQRLLEEVERSHDWMTDIRRHLHMHPEISGEEQRSTAFLRAKLNERGLESRLGRDARGLIVEPAGVQKGPKIAIRADIDALRLQDEKVASYRSREPGVMHACGHDGHSAIAAGALTALARLESDGALPWPVPWRGVFQPAEETAEGAPEMISCGALEDVAAIIALHVDPSRSVGHVGVRAGNFTASADAIDITVRGRGGHAARPHESVDAIAGAAHLVSSIYTLLPRAVDMQDPAVVSIGRIAGGHSRNVLPDEVLLEGTLRTLSPAVREDIKRRVQRLANGAAEASGLEIELHFHSGIPPVVNDSGITSLLRQAAERVVGPEGVHSIPQPSMGAEDFAFYLERTPGAMLRLGVASEKTGGRPLHSALFDLDERALDIGASILALTAVWWADPSRPRR